ncbi:MAG: hypothetical protein COC19_03825 [SAR86 cluster bacterium]|uniref:Lectin n=1 Tax=SAR86 cluster bacterium TaxID=2030880 RepID=A0A2A4MQN3_9GAMM|nr:MAG: hypothetical protein COC19_03825 [SAR86 cluster bacterium]
MKKSLLLMTAVLAAAAATVTTVSSQENAMSFFITSVGSGDGANLGGIAGADAQCQSLAQAAGSRGKTWHAYLSVQGDAHENARERIGFGPWYNAKGVMVAENLNFLHSERMDLGKQNSLTENGDMVKGRGDTPNQHDILTGSGLDGRTIDDGSNHTCNNWTSNDEGTAQAGHFDRQGGGANPNSWNSAHGTRGCSQENLVSTGGNGYFYCFAID